jgi:hypothetical protein
MSDPVTTDHAIPEAERLDLERRRLECEKLRVEIAQASAPWWTRAGYIGSLVPIAIAIAGFATGIATGFFDTERTTLKAEIETLTLRRDQLEAASESLQKKIDDGYIRLTSASAEARYAISHITSFASQFDQIEPKVTAALESLSGEQEHAVRELLEFARLSKDIAEITEQELGFVSNSLKDIPASSWATELRPTIRGQYIADRVLMEAPDGRLYDPADGRYYQAGEIGQ